MQKYKGIIVEESLTDKKTLSAIKILNSRTEGNWHLHTVLVSKNDIGGLSHCIKSSGWYMHFWKDNKMVIAFKNKIFNFNQNDNSAREKAINYGLSVGIPKEQLDFIIEE